MAIMLCITGTAFATEKTQVTIYTARDTNVIEYVQPLFEAAYPQYTLEVLNMGAQEILERVRAEKANPQGDFLWGGTEAAFKLAAQEGLLGTYTPTFAADFPPSYKDPNDLWYGEILLPEVVMYNSDALSEADLPKDWDDLLGEAYKDAFIIRGVLASGTMRTIYSCMIYAKGGSDPEPGYEWLRKFDANTKEYAQNPTDMYLKIARQEGTISLWNLQDIMIQKIVNEQPFSYVIPESGVPILVDAVGIVNGAKNEEGAKAFYEFLFTPEIKLALAENMYQIPAQGDIPADQLPQWIRDLELKAMDIDWSVIAENEMTWMTYWDENIKGKN
jgi:iron(III) transport system substrate-binding protein